MISEVKRDTKAGTTTVTRISTEVDEPCGKDTGIKFMSVEGIQVMSDEWIVADSITAGTLPHKPSAVEIQGIIIHKER